MRKSLILLGILLAVISITQTVCANTVYDVLTGLQSNVTGLPNNAPTEWVGYAATQPHNNGWSYAYLNSTVLSPQGWWMGNHGSSFTLNPADYIPMGYVWSLGRADIAIGWGIASAQGDPQIVNGSPTSARVMGVGTPWGTAVGLNNGGGSHYGNWNAITWTCPANGILNISFTCYGMASSVSEIQLGIYHAGAYAHLADTTVSATTWSGHPEVVPSATISANVPSAVTGDVIWLVHRSAGWSGNNAQNHASVSGNITLSQGSPGSISGTVTSSLGGAVAGVTVSAGSSSTATAADGTFQINGLDPGSYTVTAQKIPGYVNGTVSNVTVTSGTNTPNVGVTIIPWGTITGVISDIYGPVSGATVSTDSTYPVTYQTATTDATGHYSIMGAAGSYTVYAKAAKHIDGSVSPVIIANATTTTQNITLVSWGKLAGTVSGSSGVISGATVKDPTGTYIATTAADGTYSILIPAGSYSMTAIKPGLDSSTHTVVMTNDTTTTQNFTLGDGVVISGTVTNALPPNAPVAGVSVWPGDGSNSAVTDSAGHYSLGVSRGTYIINYAKIGYAPQGITVTATSNATQNVSMAQGWDLATEFNATNPNGVWTYGYDLGTGGTFTNMATVNTDYAGLAGIARNYQSNAGQGNNVTMFVKSTSFVPILDAIWSNANAWREGQKVVSSPGITWAGMTGNERTIARFTAPNGGNYKVTARFAGVKLTGTTTSVAVRSGNGVSFSYLYGNPATSPQSLNGFVGRESNLYSDSSGATPVLVYSQTMDLVQGQTLDAILSGVGTGWTQEDLTIAKTNTIIMGRVTSDLPGNPPVIGAKVTASSGGNPYTTNTDANGNYILSVSANDYEIVVEKANFDNGSGIASINTDQVITKNFTLHHQGKWDVSKDFTYIANPNGQWSYGDLNPVSGYVFTPYDTTSNWYDPRIPNTSAPNFGTGSGTSQPINVWTISGGSQIAQNQAATPFIWVAWQNNPLYARDTVTYPLLTDDPAYTQMYTNRATWQWYIEPQAVYLDSAANRNHLAAVRWTSPDARIINIHGRFIKSGNNYDQQGSIVKNGNVLLNRVISGFVGTNAAGYTDSIGVAPIQSFSIVMPVTTGDTFDFVQDLNWQSGHGPSPNNGYNGFPQSNVGLEVSIDPGVGTACSTISQVLSQPVGTTVYMLNGVTITADVTRYLNYNFFASSDDRSQAIKLIGDATTTQVAEGWKTKFSGTVVVDPADSTKKAVLVTGIYDQVAATAILPIGFSGKALAASPTSRSRWVKVWGKVLSKTVNTGSDNINWPYEYFTIDDGSGVPVKIMMHVQNSWMDDTGPNADEIFLSNIQINDYISVVGIVGTSNGTDFVVMPRRSTDFQHNWIKEGF